MNRYPKRPQGRGFHPLTPLIVRPEGYVIERWVHLASGASVCSSIYPVDDVLTYHVSIEGRGPARAILAAFDMRGAEEDNVGPTRARHFWLPAAQGAA